MLSARSFDSMMIDGIQVVTFQAGHAIQAGSEELRALQDRSRNLDRLIKNKSKLERED